MKELLIALLILANITAFSQGKHINCQSSQDGINWTAAKMHADIFDNTKPPSYKQEILNRCAVCYPKHARCLRYKQAGKWVYFRIKN